MWLVVGQSPLEKIELVKVICVATGLTFGVQMPLNSVRILSLLLGPSSFPPTDNQFALQKVVSISHQPSVHSVLLSPCKLLH